MPKTTHWLFLRSALLLLALLALSPPLGALSPTPDTGEGPFAPPDDTLPSDNDLTSVPGGTGLPQGELLELAGTMVDVDGTPVGGARIVIWQTDDRGKYNHPRERRVDDAGQPLPLDLNFQYWGRTETDAAGHFRFRTILPGSYGRPRHIHYKVQHPDYQAVASEMQFPEDPKRASDFVTGGMGEEQDRLLVDLEKTPAADGATRANFSVVLQK